MIMGTGFPPFRGGLLRYADALGRAVHPGAARRALVARRPALPAERAAQAPGRARREVLSDLRAFVSRCVPATFSTDPEPLTPRQRAIVIVVALVCAATRFLALARSVWDWDEALFTMAMRDYDVTLHHPHPPGFPGLHRPGARGAARRARRFPRAAGRESHRRDAGLSGDLSSSRASCACASRPASSAGALFAFFPNVWFFGGGAFSDIPSIVLVLFAVTLLLRGARDRNAYWLGTLLLALAIGIRPQNC